MENALHFVDGFQPDRKSQKLMRRHVMKGKNTGKKVTRRSIKDLIVHVQPFNSTLLSSMSERKADPRTAMVRRSLGSTVFTGMSIDMEVDYSAQGIINEFFYLTSERLYPTTIGFPVSEAQHLWACLLFTDEAAYNCNISLMQTCIEIYQGQDTTTKALSHLSKTLCQTQKRIVSHHSISDSTMGLINSLITQEQIRNQRSAALVHAAGLYRMVELRGGINQLETNPTLLLAVCKSDILLSFQFGETTKFFRNGLDKVWARFASFQMSLEGTLDVPCLNLNPDLHAIFLDTMEICRVLNLNTTERVLDLLHLEEIFVSMCYRLLRFLPIYKPFRQINTDNAVNLGLLLFMVSVFFPVREIRVIEFKVLSLRFHDFLHSDLSHLETDVCLWLGALGGMWCLKDSDTNCFMYQMRQFGLQSGMGSNWNELQLRVCKFPWIGAIHDGPAKCLWGKF